MGMRAIKFEVVEALRFAAVHTGGAETFSRELVYATPLPSTVLGALGAINEVRLSEEVCRGGLSDLKALAEELGGGPLDLFAPSCDEPLLWGALVEARGRLFFCVEAGLMDVSEARNYVSAVLEEGEVKPYKSLKCLIRLGIKLTDQKVAEPGYMYKIHLHGYDVEPYPASLVYLTNVAIRAKSGVVRLGGEGRLVKFSVEEPPEGLVKASSEEGEYAIALSPILFYSEGEVRPGETRGLEEVEEVCGVLVGGAKKLKAVSVGLGFSEVCKRRRPVLQALPHGTVVKLKRRRAKAVGLLSCLGYGSLLKVST